MSMLLYYTKVKPMLDAIEAHHKEVQKKIKRKKSRKAKTHLINKPSENLQIHDKKSIIDMVNQLPSEAFTEVVDFIKFKLKQHQKHRNNK